MAFSAHKDEESIKEHLDAPDILQDKLDRLADLVRASRHMVAFTGAGISTSAGIPDFRGPQGVWTLQAQGKPAAPSVENTQAFCTPTHMALVKLEQEGVLKHLISQNCDGLHRKSGFNPFKLSELHGNCNMEECESCSTRFFRDFECDRLGFTSDHFTGRYCALCGGRLMEWTIDFDQSLPQDMLETGFNHSNMADLHLVLGSSLTVSPACNMPEIAGKSPVAHLVVVNLQHTPLDHLCKLRIYAKTDMVMKGLMERLELDIPRWKLNRKILLSYANLGNPEAKAGAVDNSPASLVVQGVDPVQDNLPASLFKSVTISGDQQTTEPMVFSTPKNGSDKISIFMAWQGHYNEPAFEFSHTLPKEPSHFFLNLSYDPFDCSWSTQELVPVSENEIRLPKQLWKTMGERQSGRFTEGNNPGDWAGADFTMYKGRPAIAVLGGTLGSKTLIDPASLEGIPITSKSPKSGRPRTPKKTPFIDSKRWGHSVTKVSSASPELFVFGGWNDTDQFNDLWVYNPNVIPPMKTIKVKSKVKPSQRALHGACMNDRSIYVFGGVSRTSDNRYQYHNDLWRYRPSMNSWLRLDPRGTKPCPRAQHAQVAVGRHLFVLGGADGTQTFTDMYVCDTKKLEWRRCNVNVPGLTRRPVDQTVASLPKLRPSLSCVGPHLLASVSEEGMHIFDTRSEKWSSKPYVECPDVVGHAVSSTGNTLYLIGGGQTIEGKAIYHDISKLSIV